MGFPGTPSDELADVLATGTTDVGLVFVSMSARDPDGRDRDYLDWHTLDHRPEQYRLDGMRHALRLVSTPACRRARAASTASHDGVDHVMNYFFTGREVLVPFTALGAALWRGGRMPLRLPSVDSGVFDLTGRVAAPRVGVGADVIPWRPTTGVYLLLEEGEVSPAPLVEVDGVAGVWWHDGGAATVPSETDHRGMRLTYCYLDADPVAVAERLREPLRRRWERSGVEVKLAAPFHVVDPFERGRHLP